MHAIARRVLLAAAPSAALLPRAVDAAVPDPVEPDSLKADVAAGRLPPVKQRLPDAPLVVTPTERVGRYGGDWNMALVGGGSLSMLFRYQAYEPLLRYTPDWRGVEPNVAESVTPDASSRVFTVRLRRGMRWSDGHPYTTDDVKFWYDAVLADKRMAFTGQDYWKADGVPARLDVVDAQTFTVTFPRPNGFFPLQIAWSNYDQTTRCPKHYLSLFHADYNPGADALAKSRGFASWVQMFQTEAGFTDDNAFFLHSAKKPTLDAWMFTLAPGDDTQRAVAVRNPYYFKVDTAGNQLPYMDRVVYQMVADPQVLLLKAMQGQVDMMDQYIATTANKPVLYDNREKGGYRFYTLTSTEANVMAFQLNLNHSDPVKRALYNTRDFRAALSLALDRASLIDAVLVGQGEPAQPSIAKGDPLYNEQLAKQYTEFDPVRANALLDAVVPKKNDDGIRLDAQGRPVTIVFELDQSRTVFIDLFQLAAPMYRDVGVDVQVRPMDRSLWETRVRQGRDFDATAHQFGANGGIAALLDPRYYVPTDNNAMYAPGWQLWFRDRTNPQAVEPPAITQTQYALYTELIGTADPAAQAALMKQILQLAADAFYVWGICQPPESYGIVRNTMHNITMTMPTSFGWPTPAPTRPEQFFKS